MKRLKTEHGYIAAQDVQHGVAINPKLPPMFDSTPNDHRPPSHFKFWNVPYIVTETVEELDALHQAATDEYADERRERWNNEWREQWLSAWPSGTRYEVRCLDGGAWDRSTSWGMFPSLSLALLSAGA
jgi:hypothetical protein